MGYKKLYITFAKEDTEKEILDKILRSYDICYKKIYVFSSDSLPNQVIFSYNIEEGNVGLQLDSTISLHRNPDTNTMYTIDALNSVIRMQNNGVLDVKFRVNWKEFEKKLLITEKGQLKIVPLHLKQIINLD